MIFDINLLNNNYELFKEKLFNSRVFKYNNLLKYLNIYKKRLIVSIIGNSVEGRKIFKLTFGSGEKKILIWSQMHGNESTGSLAMFDVINFLYKKNFISSVIKEKLKIIFIPMLNPDGSEKFKRRNSMNIDLNRDGLAIQCPETKTLFKEIFSFSPSILFNLHDQRSIFNVGSTPNPAVISFLAPSEDYYRTITKNRKNTMGIISRIASSIKEILPGMIGRYSDEFYPTASGDVLQKMGYSCVLFEAGYHYKDIKKKKSRKYNALAILSGLYHFTQNDNFESFYKDYFFIPENGNKLLDKIYRQVLLKKNKSIIKCDIGINIQENYNYNYNKLSFKEKIIEIGDLSNFFSREEIFIRNKSNPIIYNKEKFLKIDKKLNFKIL